MRILIVDDDAGMRESLARYLTLEGFEPVPAANGMAAQRKLEDAVFAAALVDLRMPGMDGMALLRWIREKLTRLPVIMISAHGEIQDAVEAMKLGAQDYVVKPFDPEELVIRLKAVVESERLRTLVEAAARSGNTDRELIGNDPAIQEIRTIVARVASAPSTVLITGESGTGKEIVARGIHDTSQRSTQPFVAVNIGGVPENLLESELFGHERGSFTGAVARKAGIFELAAAGTVFLDEIGDMPRHLQVKLLRVIQERRFSRLGGTQVLPVAARLIAATNRPIEDLVAEGGFREDLYYRLNVVRINVPPLRDRRADIPDIAAALVTRLNHKLGRSIKALSTEALARISAEPFPGNVRELENLLERAILFAEGETIEPGDLGLPGSEDPTPPHRGTLDALEQEAIVAALHRWEGNRTRAAQELGISRRTLQNRIREYQRSGESPE